MNLNRILLLNLRTTLVAVVICMVSGLIISIPTNYTIDAKATQFVWSGGMISTERVEQHRQRTTCFAMLGAIVGLLAAQSAFWAHEVQSMRRNDALPEPLLQKNVTDDATPQAEDDQTEPAPCVSCGAVIPAGSDSCLKCGWSYRNG